MRVQLRPQTFEAVTIDENTDALPERQRINNAGKVLLIADSGEQSVVTAEEFSAQFEPAADVTATPLPVTTPPVKVPPT